MVSITLQNPPHRVLWLRMMSRRGEETSRREEATSRREEATSQREEVTSQREEVTSRRGLLLQFQALYHVATRRSNIATLTTAH